MKMDDVASAQSENDNLRKIRARLLQWEAKNNALAALTELQQECLEKCVNMQQEQEAQNDTTSTKDEASTPISSSTSKPDTSTTISSASLFELQNNATCLDNTQDFLLWYARVHDEVEQHANQVYYKYLQQLELRNSDCKNILAEIEVALQQLSNLREQYDFVSQKTSALNTASEQLIEEQQKLQQLSDEIRRRLQYYSQVELLHQRLQSPTLSVASEAFSECLDKIDDCLEYLRNNLVYKDSPGFVVKYKHCLAKAVTLMKNYVATVMAQATAATLQPKQQASASVAQLESTPLQPSSTDAAFALYYGKYQTSAAKIKRVSQMVEARVEKCIEYEQLLIEIQQNYLNERAIIMSPAVDKAIKDLRDSHKGDHCSLMRSSCAFLVHVCQDEHRLFFQFFTLPSEQLTAYLEGLCTVLYDTMRPFIIHINHLETLAEICSILRIEMLEEHVQQQPEALEAFANTANQLLQDVQERLVFRAHLYLQSDILNYNPSAGDLAYPEKLEMMENIALSLQENQTMRRFDSRSSLVSSVSVDAESVDTMGRARIMNSPADLHGMWYPTVRRTLVCLSRLYRCVDRPIFQGLSQEALKLCIQSVAAASAKISSAKTAIDGELFEIKHLLILREQIAPFRVDFTVKETSLDFSKMRTAAFGLLQRRKQLLTMGSNNALLEFLLEGTPQIREHLLDSRKEVDRQLKMVCEQFIQDAGQMLMAPLRTFLDHAQALLASTQTKTEGEETKVNYALRQSAWASPQQISSIVQETQRLIKGKLAALQRAMQLYLSNRDTEFIIFRPIRNNIIHAFVKLEQILTTHGYTADDMIISGCPTAEQVSILLSSASILAAEGVVNFASAMPARKISTSSSIESAATRKHSFDRHVSFEQATAAQQTHMEHVPELSETPLNSSPMPPQVAEADSDQLQSNVEFQSKQVEAQMHPAEQNTT